MAKHKVGTTVQEIREALDRAKALPPEPYLVKVSYHAKLDVFLLELNDGSRHFVPRENLQGLQNASRKQIINVEILGSGTGLHWPDLDVDFSVEGLLRGIYGTKQWMAELRQRATMSSLGS